MGLIVEIGLVIWAWKRGWGRRALLPIAIGLPIVFLMGLSLETAEEFERMIGILLFLDVAVIVSLIAMIIFKRETKETSCEEAMDTLNYPSNVVHQDIPYTSASIQQLAEASRFPRFCIECGNRIECSGSFCAHCGRKIVTGVAGA